MLESRLARLDDAPGIAQLQLRSWEHRGITVDEIRDTPDVTHQWELAITTRQSEGRVIVVESNAHVVGFGAIAIVQSGEFSELVALEVHPTHRRQGVGSRLINAVADIATRMNTPAIRAWIEDSEIEAQALLRETGWDITGATRAVRTENNLERRESEWVTYLLK